MQVLRALTPEEQRVVEQADQLARERFAPRAAQCDLDGVFPYENYADLARHGLLAMAVPKEYGGLGLSARAYCLALSRIAAACGSTALTLNMHSSVMRLLAALASAEQKERYFRAVVGDGAYFATITSEPATSFRGKFSFSTLSRRTQGGWLVNGTKHFCSLSGAATYYFVWSLAEDAQKVSEGLLNTIMHQDNPGIELQKTWNSLGMRATSSHSLTFKDAFVPDADVIGAPGEVIRRQLTDVFMVGYAATYLGIAEAAFAFTREYAMTRTFQPDPNPISHHPAIQRRAAEVDIAVAAARALMFEAADAYDQSPDKAEVTLLLHRAKYLACETALQVTDNCLKIIGGRGIARALPFERFVRDARAGVVMPPNSDASLEAIGRIALGLPAASGVFGE